nr:uncharacterized protein LOC112318827 [Desmodus rotundus]
MPSAPGAEGSGEALVHPPSQNTSLASGPVPATELFCADRLKASRGIGMGFTGYWQNQQPVPQGTRRRFDLHLPRGSLKPGRETVCLQRRARCTGTQAGLRSTKAPLSCSPAKNSKPASYAQRGLGKMPVMDSSLARNLSAERRATPVGRWGPVSRDQVPSSGRCRACLGFIMGLRQSLCCPATGKTALTRYPAHLEASPFFLPPFLCGSAQRKQLQSAWLQTDRSTVSLHLFNVSTLPWRVTT